MKAVHFGAGNIGRGFIGEILFRNGFQINFVDINKTIIDALKERGEYEIEMADENQERIKVTGVSGLNNQQEPDAVIHAIAAAQIVTTAIGPNILPYIAELIAEGIKMRRQQALREPLDVIACENMIGGSEFLKEKVMTYLDSDDTAYVDQYIGFPNAAVDRIVPLQEHQDPLFVSVEPFSEWIIDSTMQKASSIHLEGVLYVEDLAPYLERKLFSVNTGHATVAYAGAYKGYTTIDEAIGDEEVLQLLTRVLNETGSLLESKWGFEHEAHQAYIAKIIGRFQNPHISDLITRVARTPLRKLGYNERFIRPIREAYERDLSHDALSKTTAMIFHYDDPHDDESVKLNAMLEKQTLKETIKTVTELLQEPLIEEIEQHYDQLDQA